MALSNLSSTAAAPHLAGAPDALDRDTALLERLLGDVLEEQNGRAFREINLDLDRYVRS